MWRTSCLGLLAACGFRPSLAPSPAADASAADTDTGTGTEAGAIDAAPADGPQPDAVPVPTIQPSCSALLRSGSGSASGLYTIDPDGSAGSGAPFEVACDMTTMAGGWTLVARERTGSAAASAGPLRYLGIDSMNPAGIAADSASGIIGDRFAGAYTEVLLVSGSTYIHFGRPAGYEMFGNTVNLAVDLTTFTTNDTTLGPWVTQAGGATLCVAASSPDVRPGDTSWAIKPRDDANTACGCDSHNWVGRGAYYGGTPNGQETVCTGWGGGWAGAKDTGVPKGGIAPTVETLIWIR